MNSDTLWMGSFCQSGKTMITDIYLSIDGKFHMCVNGQMNFVLVERVRTTQTTLPLVCSNLAY